MTSSDNIYRFLDEQTTPDPYYEYSDSLSTQATPVVIDNGSYKCRAGWACDNKPRLVFRNITARVRAKKEKDVDVQVGNDISNIEVVRGQLRSPFERNVVTHYEAQEHVLDYVFSHLGITSSGRVDHPVVMTEPPANPNSCRQLMSELLFECYGVPQVTYGLDALFSLLYNSTAPCDNALLVSCGYNTTHILPVLGGRLITEHTRRMNLGGGHLDYYLQRLLQLKNAAHTTAITLSRAEELVQTHCGLAVDYQSELEQWADDTYYNNNVHKIQLAYTQAAGGVWSAEQQKLRREQQVRRLKEVNARRREKKLAEEQEKLRQLIQIQRLAEDEDNEEIFYRMMRRLEMDSEEELSEVISQLTTSIENTRQQILNDQQQRRELELASTPDEQLTKEQREQKRRIKSAKEGQAKRARQDTRKDLSNQPPINDAVAMEMWLNKKRQEKAEILETRNERRQRRNDMTRRRTEASHRRMKILTSLAQGTKKNKVDTFGKNDDDWDVYKEINKDGGDTDSETEQEKLVELDNLLRQHDPQFKEEQGEVFDVAEFYRLHLAVERIRVAELLFQPSMLGLDQAGIAETMEFVLKKFTPEEQDSLTQRVFVTGSCAKFANFSDRLSSELRQMRPFQSTFSVETASDPVLDAWRGAAKLANSPGRVAASITRSEYEEKGGEYLKEHASSNRYQATPVTIATPVTMETTESAPVAV